MSLTKKEDNILLIHEQSQDALEETINVLNQLKVEHQAYASGHDSEPDVALKDYIDCVIVRLNERKHAKCLNMDGPQSP